MPEDPVNDASDAVPASPLKRHRAKLAALSAAVLVIAGLAAFDAVRGTAEPTQQRTVDVTHVDSPKVQVDFDRPFTNTPAATWADGEAGIVAPAAAAIGPFTVQQVSEALTKVRQAVITSRLDRSVLEQHDVERYLKLLAKDSQKNMRPVFGDNPHEAHAYATRLAGGHKLLPAAPKVQGKMWAEQGTRPGELVVHTNFVFAYAFDPAGTAKLADVMDIVAVDRWDVDYSVLTGRYAPSSLGIWPVRSQGFTYSMGCQALRAGYLAPAYSERRANAAVNSPARDREEYFDPASTLPASSTCD
ncbi:MAG: hypothetical protein ABW215_23015 [Kibdelosporangium sp.]